MKRPEGLLDSVWRSGTKRNRHIARYRGVALVLLIPLLLVAAVVLLVPRKGPQHYDKPHTLSELQNHGAGAGKGKGKAGSGAGSGSLRYAIVFDAGSTGSRIHVFKFSTEAGGGLKLESDTFEQLKPGLSSYADDPQKAAASLQPLLDTAMKTVPKEQQAATPVSLKATAGLRLLPGDKADKILAAVTSLLKQYPFKMGDDAVSIMDGKDEGAFAWLTLNYLLGRLGAGPQGTVRAIDLGGGSVQEAFAMSPEEAAAAPPQYLVKLRAGAGTTYHVYVHSYLGYGLMAGRAKVIDTNATAAGGHPCFHKGGDGSYTYGGKAFAHKAMPGAAEFKGCAAVSTGAMNLAAPCGAEAEACTFDGVWRGKLHTGATYYVSSYFWDRALESGIISDGRALSWKATPQEFAAKASTACAHPDTAALQAAFPSLKSDQAPYFCLDLSYCHQLLTAGFKLSPSQPITLVKQVEYNGQNIEASWAVGAAVNDLS